MFTINNIWKKKSGFINICQKLNNQFFEKKQLIIILYNNNIKSF